MKWLKALTCPILLTLLASCGGVGPSSITVPIMPSPPPPAGLSCGVERWFVKTLSDSDAAVVNINSVTPISIRELNGFATHCSGLPERRAFAEEFKVFEATGRIIYIALENDRDYHIALEDPTSPGFTIVTELADTLCQGVIGSPHFTAMMGARIMFESLLNARPASTLVGTTVRVRGVGFYDFAHGQRGRSQNCLELHPILSIQPSDGAIQ